MNTRRKAQRLATTHLCRVLKNLSGSPIYEVFGSQYGVGKTIRMWAGVYRMPILCFSAATEESEMTGDVVVNVETRDILSCPTREEVCRILADLEQHTRLLQVYHSGEDDDV